MKKNKLSPNVNSVFKIINHKLLQKREVVIIMVSEEPYRN